MVVLTFLARLETVRYEGLLRAGVYTGEAHGAVVAGNGFLVCQTDILHWTDADAGIAAGTLVWIHFRPQAMNHASRY